MRPLHIILSSVITFSALALIIIAFAIAASSAIATPLYYARAAITASPAESTGHTQSTLCAYRGITPCTTENLKRDAALAPNNESAYLTDIVYISYLERIKPRYPALPESPIAIVTPKDPQMPRNIILTLISLMTRSTEPLVQIRNTRITETFYETCTVSCDARYEEMLGIIEEKIDNRTASYDTVEDLAILESNEDDIEYNRALIDAWHAAGKDTWSSPISVIASKSIKLDLAAAIHEVAEKEKDPEIVAKLAPQTGSPKILVISEIHRIANAMSLTATFSARIASQSESLSREYYLVEYAYIPFTKDPAFGKDTYLSPAFQSCIRSCTDPRPMIRINSTHTACIEECRGGAAP